MAIIGGGPAGLLLSHILHRNGIESIVLERQSRRHVLERIRAGVLEAGTIALLREVGLGERMDREGHPHDGSAIAWEGRPRFFIDTKKFTGKQMMAYGQTAITEDLYAARDAASGQVIDEVGNVRLHELTSDRPYVVYEKDGSWRIDCDYVAGCDGQHGVSRSSIPVSLLKTYERSYPFGWLGIMSETPPFPELCYCYHHRGFALASMRTPMLSRYYIQCDLDAKRPRVELAQFKVLRIDARKFARMWAALISQALIDKLQIIERYNHRTKRCCVLSQDDGTSSGNRRAIECPKPGNVRKTRQCAHRSPSDCWYCSGTV